MFGVPDCVADCVRFAAPQATEWQRIRHQIDAATIVARAAFYLLRGAVSGFLLVVAFESTRALDRSSATIQRSSTRSLAVLLKKRARTSLSSDRSRSH